MPSYSPSLSVMSYGPQRSPSKLSQTQTLKAALEASLARFNTALADVDKARNVLEHFDDYALGIGNYQQPGVKYSKRTPAEFAAEDYPVSYVYGGETYQLRVGEWVIDIKKAAEMAWLLFTDNLDARYKQQAD